VKKRAFLVLDLERAPPGTLRAVQTTTLGPFTVSRLCLGAMQMGAETPAADALRMLDRFLDAGGTFIDTADTYGDGESERTLAPWLARHRDQVTIATKVRFGVSDPGGEGLAPDRIRAACDASLRRLGVDTIDLYQVHGPDPTVPIEETLAALEGLVRAGKVRALGASNFPAWLLAWSVALQDREGWAPFLSLQPQYSLVERSVELELLPFCRAAGLGVLPWGPLGAGFLTGRYTRDSMPDGRVTRAPDDLEEAAERRATERNFRVVDVLTELSATHDRPVPQLALAWLLAVPGVTAPIVGPRTLEQLENLLGATDIALTEDERRRLERPAAPPEISPQRMLRGQLDLPEVASLQRETARR
jgi:aryl-alcohol dehydrogenase-like predicted oxidoreductase